MTDNKDALEELRALSETNDVEGTYDFAPAAIAAWEKERACQKWLDRDLNEKAECEAALRAAVAKVRDELRDISLEGDPVSMKYLNDQADALDAALRGGA